MLSYQTLPVSGFTNSTIRINKIMNIIPIMQHILKNEIDYHIISPILFIVSIILSNYLFTSPIIKDRFTEIGL